MTRRYLGAAAHRAANHPVLFSFSPRHRGSPVPETGAQGHSGWIGVRAVDTPPVAAAHDAAIARINEGHCPTCSGRLTAHRDPSLTLGVDIGRTDSGEIVRLASEIPPHGYCPTCRQCCEDVSAEWAEPVYATWTGCPLAPT